MAKVDVIIPTYNRAELLANAIKSVLAQTFQDFEIIVVDDCSTDNTADVIKSFGDERIRHLRHTSNRGEGEARNTGVSNSHAPYIAFLDDDDEWLPKKLSSQVDLLENSPLKVGGIYTGYYVIEKASGKIVNQRVPTKRGDIYRDMVNTNEVGTSSTVLLRRECFERLGLFDESVVWGLDYDMWIRISREFYFEYIKEPLLKYYRHENQISNDLGLRTRGLQALLKKNEDLFAMDRRIYSRHYRDLASFYCRDGGVGEARRALMMAVRLDPLEIRNYYDLGLLLFGTKNFFRFKRAKGKILESFRPDKVFGTNGANLTTY